MQYIYFWHELGAKEHARVLIITSWEVNHSKLNTRRRNIGRGSTFTVGNIYGRQRLEIQEIARVWLGTFNTAEEAAMVYDLADPRR